MCLDRRVQVLLDAFAVKNMPAFRLNGILCDIIAQPTHSRFPVFCAKESSVVLAANYEIRMARQLTHTRNKAKDIGVICKCPSVNQRRSVWSMELTVEQRARVNIRAELTRCVRK